MTSPFFALRRKSLLKPPSASLVIWGHWSRCIALLVACWSSVGLDLMYLSFNYLLSLNLDSISYAGDGIRGWIWI